MNVEELLLPLTEVRFCSACEPDLLHGPKPTAASLEQLVNLARVIDVFIQAFEAIEGGIEEQVDKE